MTIDLLRLVFKNRKWSLFNMYKKTICNVREFGCGILCGWDFWSHTRSLIGFRYNTKPDYGKYFVDICLFWVVRIYWQRGRKIFWEIYVD